MKMATVTSLNLSIPLISSSVGDLVDGPPLELGDVASVRCATFAHDGAYFKLTDSTLLEDSCVRNHRT